MQRLTTITMLLALMALAGCATSGAPFGDPRIAEYLDPATGRVERCRVNPRATEAAALGVLFGGLGGVGGGDLGFLQCMRRLEQSGYIRIPIGPESQAELVEYDRQRAESIRRP